MPFDRLIEAVDRWAMERSRTDVFAQIGQSNLRPRALQAVASLTPAEFRDRVRQADLLVSHAGMGTILTALQYSKPIVILPRRGSLQETRNDHQVATAEKFRTLDWLEVALDESELLQCLDRLDGAASKKTLAPIASPSLLEGLRSFLAEHV